MIEENILKSIKQLFNTQKLAVLATNMNGMSYTSLVAFVATDDLKEIIFATYKDTKKHDNLLNEPRVSILIDNRKNQASDFQDAIAVSARGHGKIISSQRESYQYLYLKKHPTLSGFITSPECDLFRIKVSEYQYVSRFKNIKILIFKP